MKIHISPDDIIIGKVIPIKNKEYNYRDCSTTPRVNENGIIDKNYVDINSDGYRFCNVRIRQIKVPQINIYSSGISRIRAFGQLE